LREFNGIPITDLGEKFEEIRIILGKLLEEEKIVLNFGDRHPNPYILAFEPESKEEQIKKLFNLKFEEPIYKGYGTLKMQTNSINCCAYPSRRHLRSVIEEKRYRDKPYILSLALGEPQLSYRVFNLHVLEFYRNDPRYSYKTNDISGSISTKTDGELDTSDETFLQTFGFAYDRKIKNRYVAVFLIYLSRLTPKHQKRWKLEEFNGDTFLHPDYAKTSAGHWPEKISIFNAFIEEIRIINEMTFKITGKHLFRKTYDEYNKPNKFGFLIRPTKEEYEQFIHLLDKMMSDNLNKEFFEEGDTRKGTITLLEEWIDEKVTLSDPKLKDEMIKLFRTIRNERSKSAHHVRDDEWDNKYIVSQREIIMKAYQAVRTLRMIFAIHPRSKTIEISDRLNKVKIWNF